ncbi:MAG: cytochrome c3 family protein [Syntrophobacteraceae bacterium]
MEVFLTLLTLAMVAGGALLLAWKQRISLAENRGPIALSLLCAGAVVAFLFLFYRTPGTEIGEAQPIPFSHRVHAGVKAIQCEFCHPYAGQSLEPGLPPVEKCLYCHKYIIANHPEIRKEHHYFDTRTPTPWKKANTLPEHVVFNHERHIRKELACKECHGQVETMDRIRGKYFYMHFCIDCHRERKANIDCWLSCHN